MVEHKIDIDIFKEVTGDYYLNNNEGEIDDVIEIIEHSCFLNHRLIGNVRTTQLKEMIEMQEKRDKSNRNTLDQMLKESINSKMQLCPKCGELYEYPEEFSENEVCSKCKKEN